MTMIILLNFVVIFFLCILNMNDVCKFGISSLHALYASGLREHHCHVPEDLPDVNVSCSNMLIYVYVYMLE